MEITLQNFLCHSDRRWTIPLGKITLIRGVSGAGKSTLLKAITWALYGKPRLPASKRRIIVEIVLPELIIRRNTQPEQIALQYTVNDQPYDYSGPGAQSIINQLFGPYHRWLATSYVAQKTLNSFLGDTKDHKLEILNAITYCEDVPTTYINRLHQEVSTQYQQYEKVKNDYERRVNDVSSLGINPDIVPWDEETVTFNQMKVSQLRTRITEITQAAAGQRMLQRQLSSLIRPSPPSLPSTSYTPRDDETIDYLTTLVSHHCDPPPQPEVTESDYEDALAQEQAYREYQSVKDSFLGLSIKDHERDPICKIRQYLQLRPIVERYRYLQSQPVPPPLRLITPPVRIEYSEIPFPHRDKLRDINVLRATLSEYDDDYEAIAGKLRMAEQDLILARQLQPCPHCEKPLLIMKGTICAGDHRDTNELVTRIADLTSRLSRRDYYRKIQNEIATQERLHQEAEKWKSSQEIARLNHEAAYQAADRKYRDDCAFNERYQAAHNDQSELQSLLTKYRWLPTHDYDRIAGLAIRYQDGIPSLPSISSSTIRTRLIHQEKYRHYCVVAGSSILAPNVSPTIPNVARVTGNETKGELINRLTHMKEQREIYRRNLQNQTTYENNLSAYENQHRQLSSQIVPVDDSIIPSLEEEIASISHQLQINDRIKLYHQYHAEATLLLQAAHTQSTEVINHQGLHHEAEIAEYEFIAEKVGFMNQTLQQVCNMLFSDGLTCAIKMFHVNKSNRQEKAKICLEINHRMLTFDDYRSLSGGECDRLSLAISLALNSCAGSPFLFLDECGQSLDRHNQELFIKALRERTNCTIVVVMHEGPEGSFDHVIDM